MKAESTNEINLDCVAVGWLVAGRRLTGRNPIGKGSVIRHRGESAGAWALAVAGSIPAVPIVRSVSSMKGMTCEN